MRRLISLALALALGCSAAAAAQDGEARADTPSGQQVPRFVSLKVDVANGRSGPSRSHPIAWRYVRAGLPMEVIAETPDWRRVRDPDGEITWMHRGRSSPAGVRSGRWRKPRCTPVTMPTPRSRPSPSPA